MKDSVLLKLYKMNLGKTYCINLSERALRWQQVSAEFQRVGINDVERFEAIKRAPGFEGCRESHLDVLEKCRGLNRFTIFEDDVQFIRNPMSILQLAQEQLPDDWDMLYLGANLMKPIMRYSDNLYRIRHAYCTHAIVFNNPKLTDFILAHREGMRKIDVFYETVVQEQFKCFITYPMVATQADSYSDIIRRETKYSQLMFDNFKKNLI